MRRVDDEYFDDVEAERSAILEGIKALEEGHVRDFEEFDREFRERNGIPLDASDDIPN